MKWINLVVAALAAMGRMETHNLSLVVIGIGIVCATVSLQR